jgi:hypothetical protein
MTVASCETKHETRDKYNMFDEATEQVPICKTCSDTGAQIGFGEHLLYQGRIDAHELESALHYQNVEHVALGVLAIQENYLSDLQLCDVLDYQRLAGGLFGEISIALGFLTKDVVDTLLKMQSVIHIKIGEVLVLFGALSREVMESELNCFHELA